MIAKAKLLLLIGVTAGAFWGGWAINGWRIEADALAMYETALEETQSLYQQVLSEQNALYEAEVQKSLTLEKQNASLRESVDGLREEIGNVTFTTKTDGVCTSHPVSTVEFVGMYDRVASGGGNPEGGESDSSGVSPRDD